LLRRGRYVWLTPPKVLLQLNWLEAALHLPLGILSSKEGQSVGSYYSRLVGPGNYSRVLASFFAAVPSQKADGLPVAGPGSLFKKRTRKEEFPRSYGFHGGLQTVADAAARFAGIQVRTGVEAMRVEADGSGFRVTDTRGETYQAAVAAVAASADQAARMLADSFPALAREICRVRTVEVESAGTVLPRERCWMPECAFVVPVDDVFFSCVTRDPFPDPERRAFAFHFRPGLSLEERREKMRDVLRVPPDAEGEIAEWRHVLPSPAVGHGAIVAAIDRELAGKRLALSGNYFGGLAIEDCVLRSNAEWDRVSAYH
jgi:protoporphyrinogen/coproporphyrinogen III oxidase